MSNNGVHDFLRAFVESGSRSEDRSVDELIGAVGPTWRTRREAAPTRAAWPPPPRRSLGW